MPQRPAPLTLTTAGSGGLMQSKHACLLLPHMGSRRLVPGAIPYWIDPEADLVVASRWLDPAAIDQFLAKVYAAL